MGSCNFHTLLREECCCFFVGAVQRNWWKSFNCKTKQKSHNFTKNKSLHFWGLFCTNIFLEWSFCWDKRTKMWIFEDFFFLRCNWMRAVVILQPSSAFLRREKKLSRKKKVWFLWELADTYACHAILASPNCHLLSVLSFLSNEDGMSECSQRGIIPAAEEHCHTNWGGMGVGAFLCRD